jgi:hypothetical protein
MKTGIMFEKKKRKLECQQTGRKANFPGAFLSGLKSSFQRDMQDVLTQCRFWSPN